MAIAGNDAQEKPPYTKKNSKLTHINYHTGQQEKLLKLTRHPLKISLKNPLSPYRMNRASNEAI